MSMRRKILGFLVCLSIALFVGQTLSQTRSPGRTRERSGRDRARTMAREQRQKELKQLGQQRQLERQIKKQIDPANIEDESMKEALEVTDQQWKVIKPKLEKVRELRSRASTSIRMVFSAVGLGVSKGFGGGGYGFGGGGGFGGGSIAGGSSGQSTAMTVKDSNPGVNVSPGQYGWQWLRPSERKGSGELTEGEKICEELLELLEDKDANEQDIRQKMEALRKFRQEAKKELAIARQELREVVTFRQEATLVMMRLLD